MLLLNNKNFIRDYNKLKNVSLNPKRHTAKTAFEHSELVAKRCLELADINNLSSEEKIMLQNLAYVHDIGKIEGTANPVESVKKLSNYGISDENFLNLVKYHDINLPWYISYCKGESPSDKAWKKLVQKTNIRILCLFMIADRIDCPGGWKSNKPLVWFLEEVKKRKLLEQIRIE